MTALRAVTYNLGCGGPHPPERVQAADEWAAATRADGYNLVFVQEVPSGAWLDGWRATHQVFTVTEPQYRVRSALLVSAPLVCAPLALATQRYHGSYVAAATVTLPDGRAVTCLSVHASPSRVTPEWQETWEQCGAALPLPRTGEGLWDSDLLLATVLAGDGTRLIAGDWNEARAWDLAHLGTSGAEFFKRVDAGGLIDCTFREWDEERPTCRPNSGAPMQVDRVFATSDIAADIRDLQVGSIVGSDHARISFSVHVV